VSKLLTACPRAN